MRYMLARGYKIPPTVEEIAKEAELRNKFAQAMMRGRCVAQEWQRKAREERRARRGR